MRRRRRPVEQFDDVGIATDLVGAVLGPATCRRDTMVLAKLIRIDPLDPFEPADPVDPEVRLLVERS